MTSNRYILTPPSVLGLDLVRVSSIGGCHHLSRLICQARQDIFTVQVIFEAKQNGIKAISRDPLILLCLAYKTHISFSFFAVYLTWICDRL